MLMV
jgi:hypothetical protein